MFLPRVAVAPAQRAYLPTKSQNPRRNLAQPLELVNEPRGYAVLFGINRPYVRVNAGAVLGWGTLPFVGETSTREDWSLAQGVYARQAA